MRSYQFLLLVALIGVSNMALAQTGFPILPWAKASVQVVDEKNQPIPDAKVVFCFSEPFPKWGSDRGQPVTIKSNSNGKATATGHAGLNLIINVSKDGYYPGAPPKIAYANTKFDCWQPWDPQVTVVLKKIINPIPMYAKNYRGIIPAYDQPVGFDMIVADWVKPFGKGTTPHFIFKFSKEEPVIDLIPSKSHFKVTSVLTFPNHEDGMQPVAQQLSDGFSMLRFPREAPAKGYLPSIDLFSLRDDHGQHDQKSDGIGYVFRTETATDAQGSVSANYGKIDGTFSFFGQLTKTPGIAFTYYLNPDRTPNLEFDPAQNLLKNLDTLEEVRKP